MSYSGNQTKTSYFKSPWFLLAAATRIFSAFYLLVNPYWGVILYLIFDWTDSQLMIRLAHLSREEYHHRDKIFDGLGYLTMLIASYLYGFGHSFLLVLFLLRLIGLIIFFVKKNLRWFILFPDLFTWVVAWLVLFENVGKSIEIYSQNYWQWIGVIFIFKMIQEIYLHYYWDGFTKKHGFECVPISYWFRKGNAGTSRS
jgi:hypothetical protein